MRLEVSGFNKSIEILKANNSKTAIGSLYTNTIEEFPIRLPFDRYTVYQEGNFKKFGAELELLNHKSLRKTKRPSRQDQLKWEWLLQKPLKRINVNSRSVIYKITNKKELNSFGAPKFYIGMTTGTIYGRMRNHFRSALKGRGCKRLATAIQQYGIQAFRVEILYQGPHLRSKEHKLIATYNATDPAVGYNIAK